MKLTLLATLSLTLLQWTSLTSSAETIRDIDVHEEISSEDDATTILEAKIDETLFDTERSLQNVCGTTKWDDVIVFELEFDSLRCFIGIAEGSDVPLSNADAKLFVDAVQRIYPMTYNWMQGLKKSDYAVHCDPFSRTVAGATVQRLSRSRNETLL